jgi:arginyl-tRNA synthetase
LENAPINKVERIIVRFPDVVCRATNELSPNILAEYLLELASSFNSFYAEEQIVDKNNEFTSHKVKISFVVSSILQKGLDLLGIKIPERM